MDDGISRFLLLGLVQTWATHTSPADLLQLLLLRRPDAKHQLIAVMTRNAWTKHAYVTQVNVRRVRYVWELTVAHSRRRQTFAGTGIPVTLLGIPRLARIQPYNPGFGAS